MDFEIINKAHKELNQIRIKDKAFTHITVEKKSFYFTNEIARISKMNGEDKYVQFIRGKDANGKHDGRWYFVVNKDNLGFKLVTLKSGGARINSMPLVRLFTQNNKTKIGESYFIQKTEHEYNKSPVFEILTYKSVGQLKKNV